MKNIIKISALTITVGAAILFGCKKNDQNAATNTSPKPNLHALAKQNSETGASFSLHRAHGTKKGTIWNGQACECRKCFGVCGGSLADETNGDLDMLINAVASDNGDGTTTLYILEAPDDDVNVDATLYIDEDVFCTNATGTNQITFKAGQYPYVAQSSTKTFAGKDYNCYGTVVVKTE